jgi:hypothetical protein
MTNPPSRQRGRHKTTYCNGQSQDVKYGHESQKGLDTKKDWLTDRQS